MPVIGETKGPVFGGKVAVVKDKAMKAALNTQDKWSMQKLQYAQALIDAKGAATNLTAHEDHVARPADLSTWRKLGLARWKPQRG